MFDINEVRISGEVLSVDGGSDINKGDYSNVYIKSQGKKYSETIAVAFYGENATKANKELNEGDKLFVSGKLLGKKIIDQVSMRLVGNYFFRIK